MKSNSPLPLCLQSCFVLFLLRSRCYIKHLIVHSYHLIWGQSRRRTEGSLEFGRILFIHCFVLCASAWIIRKRDNEDWTLTSETFVHLYLMHMISLNMNMLLVCPLFWNQGDMGPLGEMGLPGPNGLKVISETQMETVAIILLYCLLWTAL